jgi:hypothetical protein
MALRKKGLVLARAKRFGFCIRSTCIDFDEHGRELTPAQRKEVKKQTRRRDRRRRKNRFDG